MSKITAAATNDSAAMTTTTAAATAPQEGYVSSRPHETTALVARPPGADGADPTRTTRTTAPHRSSGAEEVQVGVNPTDVLCGRGGRSNTHPGNRLFRRIIYVNRPHYQHSKTSQRLKQLLVESIVLAIKRQGGRFVRKVDGSKDSWVEIPDKEARVKTAQGLREETPPPKEQEPTATATGAETRKPPPDGVGTDDQKNSPMPSKPPPGTLDEETSRKRKPCVHGNGDTTPSSANGKRGRRQNASGVPAVAKTLPLSSLSPPPAAVTAGSAAAPRTTSPELVALAAAALTSMTQRQDTSAPLAPALLNNYTKNAPSQNQETEIPYVPQPQDTVPPVVVAGNPLKQFAPMRTEADGGPPVDRALASLRFQETMPSSAVQGPSEPSSTLPTPQRILFEMQRGNRTRGGTYFGGANNVGWSPAAGAAGAATTATLGAAATADSASSDESSFSTTYTVYLPGGKPHHDNSASLPTPTTTTAPNSADDLSIGRHSANEISVEDESDVDGGLSLMLDDGSRQAEQQAEKEQQELQLLDGFEIGSFATLGGSIDPLPDHNDYCYSMDDHIIPYPSDDISACLVAHSLPEWTPAAEKNKQQDLLSSFELSFWDGGAC